MKTSCFVVKRTFSADSTYLFMLRRLTPARHPFGKVVSLTRLTPPHWRRRSRTEGTMLRMPLYVFAKKVETWPQIKIFNESIWNHNFVEVIKALFNSLGIGIGSDKENICFKMT